MMEQDGQYIMRLAMIIAGVIITAAGNLYADGLPFDGDRYKGPAVVLELNGEQQAIPKGKINLTDKQIEIISSATGKKVSWIQKMDLFYAQNTCACEELNLGIIYGKYAVVPLPLVGNSLEEREFGKFPAVYYEYKIPSYPAGVSGKLISASIVCAIVLADIYYFRKRRKRAGNV